MKYHLSRIAISILLLVLVAGCSTGQVSTLETPGVTPDTILSTAQVEATSTPSPTATFSPVPTAIQEPVSLTTPMPDPTQEAIREELLRYIKPVVTQLSRSPDETWQIDLLSYPCTLIQEDMPDGNAYDILRAVQVKTGLTYTIDDQLLNCGGLGAYGLGEVTWSPNSRYYYYTDARQGSPDGGALGWLPSFYRFDTQSQSVEVIGQAAFSPEKQEVAAGEIWVKGQWFPAPLALTIWDANGPVLARFETHFRSGASQFYVQPAWSPDGSALAYVEAACAPAWACESSLYLVERSSWERTLLVDNRQPAFMNVAWNDSGHLLLTDANFEKWDYDLMTGELEAEPG